MSYVDGTTLVQNYFIANTVLPFKAIVFSMITREAFKKMCFLILYLLEEVSLRPKQCAQEIGTIPH